MLFVGVLQFPYFFLFFSEVEKYRALKMENEQEDGKQIKLTGSEDEPGQEIKDKNDGSPEEIPTSSQVENSPLDSAEKLDRSQQSPKPEVVSSSLHIKDQQPQQPPQNKSLEMLKQIFPGKPVKILEIKLRENRGDVVKALEACAKYFDLEASHQRPPRPHPTVSSSSAFSPQTGNAASIAVKAPSVNSVTPENNNNPFLYASGAATGSGHVADTGSKLVPPPFSAVAAALASHHKSAFVPTAHPLYRNPFLPAASLTGSHNAAQPEMANYFSAKELFPFPPPIFPPSFFVGFGAAASGPASAASTASPPVISPHHQTSPSLLSHR